MKDVYNNEYLFIKIGILTPFCILFIHAKSIEGQQQGDELLIVASVRDRTFLGYFKKYI